MEPESPASEGPVDVPPPSEKALRYHRSGNVVWAVEHLLGLALPAAILLTGLSARLRTIAGGVAHGRFYPTLVVYLALLSALLFVVQLPLSFYVGYRREHAYGLSSQRLGKWAADELKGLLIGVLLGAAVLWVPYLLLGASRARWRCRSSRWCCSSGRCSSRRCSTSSAPCATRRWRRRCWRSPRRRASRGRACSRWRRASTPRRSTPT